MRDPDRIKKVLTLLEKYWTQKECRLDYRLTQIIFNLTGKNDPYYVEDHELINRLEEEIRKTRLGLED